MKDKFYLEGIFIDRILTIRILYWLGYMQRTVNQLFDFRILLRP